MKYSAMFPLTDFFHRTAPPRSELMIQALDHARIKFLTSMKSPASGSSKTPP